MITIIDYGMGNLGSISNTLDRINIECKISSKIEDIENADKLILPGVGFYKKGMENLNKLGLVDILEKKVIKEKTPILGICLGMQLFSEKSEEGNSEGLGWIKSEIVKFSFEQKDSFLRIPHMGWNNVIPSNDSGILKNVDSKDRFYFVHSYHFSNAKDEDVSGKTQYGYTFPSVVENDHIIGIQCHPERSHKSGIKILNNFDRM